MTAVMRLAVIVALAVAVPAMSAQAPDVSGTWLLTVELDIGSGRPTVTFTQDGDTLTGRYEGIFGSADVTGTVDGNRVDFSFEVSGTKATYAGTLDERAMRGTCEYDGLGSGAWEALRADEGA